MAFTLTKYIYPLESQIELSTKYGYKLDNPRTDKEIELVKKFVFKTLDRRDSESRIVPLVGRTAHSMDSLQKWLNLNRTENYETKHIDEKYKGSTIDYLCQIWVILRFDEDETFNKFLDNQDGLVHTIMTNSGKEYETKFYKVVDYCHTLSLIGHQNEEFFGTTYHGESFLLNKSPFEIFFTNYSDSIYRAVEHFQGFNGLLDSENRAISWLYWIDGGEFLIKQAVRLETLIIQSAKPQIPNRKKLLSQKQTPSEKLEHVGSILSTAYEHHKDPKLMLLLLVSIIEYLLTRNPDTSKFNVEDSISKQFKPKCALVIHNQNKEIDLTDIHEKLKNIYNYRSDVAHGNYNSGFDIKNIVNSVYDLYVFLKCIINEFIDDRDVIEYVKDN